MEASLKKMATDCGADTPVHETAYAGNSKKLKSLLSQSEMLAKINQKNWLGCTPLRLAASGMNFVSDINNEK